MAYPPSTPPNNRENTTPMVDNHPSDHNLLVDAISDILVELGPDPSGSYTNLTERLNEIVGQASPTGQIIMSGSPEANPPAGDWLLCDGTAYDRATYAGLFGVIGTTFGAGNGSTTFNVPDMRGRSPVGAGQVSGGPAIALGDQFGTPDWAVVTHNHSINHGHGDNFSVGNNNRGHTHSINHGHGDNFTTGSAGAHNHNLRGGADSSTGGGFGENNIIDTGQTQFPEVAGTGSQPAHTHTINGSVSDHSGNSEGESQNHTHSISGGVSNHSGNSGDTGASGADKNYHPTLGVTFWIKY